MPQAHPPGRARRDRAADRRARRRVDLRPALPGAREQRREVVDAHAALDRDGQIGGRMVDHAVEAER